MARPRKEPPGIDLPKGTLTEPIRLNPVHCIFADGTPRDFIERHLLNASREARIEKLFYLAGLKEIDISSPQGWQKLALALATAYIPGMQVAAPKLSKIPTKWHFDAECQLIVEYTKRKTSEKSDRQIFQNIASRKLILDKKGKAFTAGALKKHLQELHDSGRFASVQEGLKEQKAGGG